MSGERQLASFVGLEWFADAVIAGLGSICSPEAAPDDLNMFVCEPGHPRNLYTCAGLPRSHNAWEMQLLLDDGLLFFVYVGLCDASRGGTRDKVERLCELLDHDDPERLRRFLRDHYAANIADAVRSRQSPGAAFERVVIDAYLRLAITAPRATITLDLFPAHTDVDNVSEGLKGLVPLRDASRRGARKFYCCRAESYTRYYGLNLAKQLGVGALRFALVVPYANSVRHIVLTRCWPIDGAENIARRVDALYSAWSDYQHTLGQRGDPPKILVSGYSQGGAAVRLFNDALCGVDVITRAHFKSSAPRWYASRCRALAQIIAGGWSGRREIAIYTVSIATMGGIDGVGFSEGHEHLRDLGADQRGAAGVRSHANRHAGLHLGICHDFDPARWVVPGPLLPNPYRRLRRRARKLTIVQILLKFGGPGLVFHGGTWADGTDTAFVANPAAKALLDDVASRRMSPRFVDQDQYVDDRCSWGAFAHLVVGTHGYPGWVVVAKFEQALAKLAAKENSDEPLAELTHEPSWSYDILPDDHEYDVIVGSARAFHQRLQRRAKARLAKLERARRGGASTSALTEALRARVVEPLPRKHMLRELE